jgi:hypothetical protein
VLVCWLCTMRLLLQPQSRPKNDINNHHLNSSHLSSTPVCRSPPSPSYLNPLQNDSPSTLFVLIPVAASKVYLFQ